MRYLVKTTFAVVCSLPATAFALPDTQADALLTQINGTVLVDAGEGFVPVTENARLRLGDRVMVTNEGHAVLSYGEACSFPLEAPSMITVEATACTTATQGEPENNNTTMLVTTGLPIAGSLGLLGAALLDEDETPDSP